MKYDGITGQRSLLYTPSAGNYASIAVHTDGTVFVLDDSDTQSPKVVGIDSITGARKFSVAVDVKAPEGNVAGTAFVGGVIIAGDGYAYVPYQYRTSGQGWPTYQINHFRLLRIESEGAHSVIDIKDWETSVFHYPAIWCNMITNADTGVLLSCRTLEGFGSGDGYADAYVPYHSRTAGPGTPAYQVNHFSLLQTGSGASTGYLMVKMAGTSASPISPPEVPGQCDSIAPVLQAQDGSFVGAVSTGEYCTSQTMIAFDAAGAVRWSVSGNYTPKIATADGGFIATTEDGSAVTFDLSGNATGQIANFPTYSWKGAYQVGSVLSVVAPFANAAFTYATFKDGNISGNRTYTRTTRFGLAWCGTNFPGGLSSCGSDTEDLAFLYHNICHGTLPDADFTTEHPEWIQIIQYHALETLRDAFRKYAISVEVASKNGKATWAECQIDPACSGTTFADQGHVVRVAGDLNNPPFGKTYGPSENPLFGTPVNASNVYYYPIMTNSVAAWWSKDSPSNDSNWCPTYSLQPSATDLQKFNKIMKTIGVAIGNMAAHEVGHHLSRFPYMDCRPGGCQDNDNFVYNFYSGMATPSNPSNPGDPANGGLFFYGLDVNPIHWGQRNDCYLTNWAQNEVTESDRGWTWFWKTFLSSNGCQR